MPNFNRVILMGNLTADPELRYTQSGTPVCTLSLAVNEYYTTPSGEKKQDVLFIRITMWKKQAETCAEYLKKGSPVMIEGRLKMNQWTTSEGQKRSTIEVVGSKMQLLGTGSGQGKGKDIPPPETEMSQETSGHASEPEEGGEDIPF